MTVLRSGEATLDEPHRYRSVGQPPEVLYLELIKRALSFILWPEPPMPLDTANCCFDLLTDVGRSSWPRQFSSDGGFSS